MIDVYIILYTYARMGRRRLSYLSEYDAPIFITIHRKRVLLSLIKPTKYRQGRKGGITRMELISSNNLFCMFDLSITTYTSFSFDFICLHDYIYTFFRFYLFINILTAKQITISPRISDILRLDP